MCYRTEFCYFFAVAARRKGANGSRCAAHPWKKHSNHSFPNAFRAISMVPGVRSTPGRSLPTTVFSMSCREVRIGPCGSEFTVQPQFSQCFPSNFHGSRHAAHPQPGEARASPAQHALYLLGRQGRPNKIVHFLLMLTARVLRI